MRHPHLPLRLTGMWLVAPVASIVLLLVGVIVISPLALPWIAGARTDWVTPANIGQAYGGVAAVLAGLALCGVVVSLAVQRRQLAVQLNLAVRERQFDLTRMLLEYPEATAKLFGSSISTEGALLNLHIAQCWLVFDTQAADPASMSAELALVFKTEEARLWWAEGGGLHWRTFRAKRSAAFARMVDEAVELARSWNVGDDSVGDSSAEQGEQTVTRIGAATGILVGAGVLWWVCRKAKAASARPLRRGRTPY